MATNRKTLEQGRAAFAYECVATKLIPTYDSKVQKAYKSYVKKIPMMIKTNGLGNTFAFVLSKHKGNNETDKKDYAYNLIYKHTTEWLTTHTIELKLQDSNADLVRAIINLESAEYRALTVEVLAFFGWLKRFAEGLIEGEDES